MGDSQPAAHRVTLVTTPACGLCDQAKEVLDRLSREVPLEVEILDVATPAGQAAVAGAGMAFPPAVLVDGRPFSYGRLSERKLRRALGLTRR